MITVYHSNQLEMLKMLICREINKQPLRHPLSPEVMLVNSPNMVQWLKLSFSLEFGIAANINFLSSSDFIWNFLTLDFQGSFKKKIFSKSSMCWKLRVVIPKLLLDDTFSMLRYYLRDDSDNHKLFQLTEHIANVFEQYIFHCPHWIHAWEEGRIIKECGDFQLWQGPLWLALVEYTKYLGEPVWSFSALFQRLLLTLKNIDKRLSTVPERVFIFGLSALPNYYIQALEKYIDIHIFFTNPCRYYWGDIWSDSSLKELSICHRYHYKEDSCLPQFRDSRDDSLLFNSSCKKQQLTNPLLDSWGHSERENLFLLAQSAPKEICAFVDIVPINLLCTLQKDILELEDYSVIGLSNSEWNNSLGKRILEVNDRSIEIHLCHSIQREIEVLQNQLLDMMAADPALSAHEIIVTAVDIDIYTPFIQAVFSNALPSRYIPFSISDSRISKKNIFIKTFSALLNLLDGRFIAEEVWSILEVPVVASRFSIDEQGLIVLRRWIVESGIRWGLDDDNIRDLDLPMTNQNTWRFGLNRMLLGYAMHSTAGEWKGVLPFDESHGLIAELTGYLSEFMLTLNRWRECIRKPHDLESWVPMCRLMLDDFFLRTADNQTELALIEERWYNILYHGMQASYHQTVPFFILREDLLLHLKETCSRDYYLPGSINFCTLMPMMFTPIKVVCLLGMNEGVFPCIKMPSSLNLINQTTKKDNINYNDSYLFLEALNAAQKKFYISYISQSIQDNTTRYPSILVSELTQYISQSFCLARDRDKDVDTSAQSIVQHLQHVHTCMPPFFQESVISKTKSINGIIELSPIIYHQGFVLSPIPQESPHEDKKHFTLYQFLQFWRHPVRYFFKCRLGISFQVEHALLLDAEPFVLNSLTRYQLDQNLLKELINQSDSERLYKYYRSSGQLAHGVWGELFWQERKRVLHGLSEQILRFRSSTENKEILLNIQDMTLSGVLDQIQTDGLLRWRPGVLNVRDGFILWLEHLIYCAIGGQGISLMLGLQNSIWRFLPISVEKAKQHLEYYMNGYFLGMSNPLVLTHSGGAWLQECFDKNLDIICYDGVTQNKAYKKLLERWNGSDYMHGEKHDYFLQRLLPYLDTSEMQTMILAAETWLLPVIRSHQVG
ncbi:exodeoxyribonuclease V subunit gamma [Candidatus Erwinia haradaeae]|uniref:RecBCD enzyme subunit RecC n=1 Tax=Candidatus Erwinia haradaeae TaxID=1922217 RepID=A0A451DIB1_9GAMM|nr:exodeoxyribonuclease V subunit gamma [Candidatus Erwinia haradaeae]VFP86351.1 RecBCD enzyme subunit RecC [Candidatus Erwinia haradaeae]